VWTVNAGQVRDLAAGLPGAEEYDYGGRPSFRVRGRPRFASGLDEHGIYLALGEEGTREAVAEWSHACDEDWHGQRLVSVRVACPLLPDAVVAELVIDAWARRAPARLVSAYRGQSASRHRRCGPARPRT
jgi:hypothetical protein